MPTINPPKFEKCRQTILHLSKDRDSERTPNYKRRRQKYR